MIYLLAEKAKQNKFHGKLYGSTNKKFYGLLLETR